MRAWSSLNALIALLAIAPWAAAQALVESAVRAAVTSPQPQGRETCRSRSRQRARRRCGCRAAQFKASTPRWPGEAARPGRVDVQTATFAGSALRKGRRDNGWQAAPSFR
jgi:hypothetical protein